MTDAKVTVESQSASKSRLMILKLTIENFKSYGGVKEIGPFHKSFSSVVGPNGSGKSNVIDAMLFVFGKKASKLRLNRLSELIHKSAEYPHFDYARVTVYFQDIIDTGEDDDSYVVVPNSQFTVTRSAHKDNTSRFYIDGRASSFTEVTTLLKSKGIDLNNNRFLILQGEVELISQMKPKAQNAHEEGLLEYLEDIIGTNELVAPIEEAAKVVETLTEARSEKIKRVQIAEREKAGLESAKLEAESLLAKERDLLRQKGNLVQKMMYITAKNYVEAKKKHEKAAEELAHDREKLAKYTEQVEVLQKELEESQKVAKAIAEVVAAAKKAFSEAEHRDIKAREQLKNTRAKQRAAEELIARETKRLEEMKATFEKASASIPALEKKVAKYAEDKEKEEKAHEEVMASLKGKSEALRGEVEAKQKLLGPVAEALSIAQGELETAKTELRIFKSKAEKAEKKLSQLVSQLEKQETELISKRAEEKKAQAELEKQKKRQEEIATELQAKRSQEETLVAKTRELRQSLSDAQAQISAESGRGGLLAKLRAAANPNGPLAGSGLYGRLGDMAVIDQKYDVAITTACGQLDWFVVETAEGAQMCVEYLRKHNLGRAKFIILDKIKWIVPQMERVLRGESPTPAGAERLFDLIQLKDPKFQAAFFFAVRDTLVAETMDKASQIAYNQRERWRVVTLSGELIETSGTMSGGGSRPRRGGMGLIAKGQSVPPAPTFENMISASDFEKMEREYHEYNGQLTVLRKQISTLQTELRDVERFVPRAQQQLTKLRMEISAFEAIVEDIKKQVGEARSNAASSSSLSTDEMATQQALTERVSALEADTEMIRKEHTRLESELNVLQRNILEAGGEQVARAKARLERVTEAMDKASKELAKANADVQSSTRILESIMKAIDKATEEVAETGRAIETIRNETLAQIEKDALEAMQATKAAEAEMAEKEAIVLSIRQKATAIEKEVRSLRVGEEEKMLEEQKWLAEKTRYSEALASLSRKFQRYFESYLELVAERVRDVRIALADLEEPAESSGEGDKANERAEGGEDTEKSVGQSMEVDSEAEEAGGQENAATPKKKRNQKGAKKTKETSNTVAESELDIISQSVLSDGASLEDILNSKTKANIIDITTLTPRVAEALQDEPLSLPLLSSAALKKLNRETLELSISTLENEKTTLAKKVNMGAIAEYRQKEKEYLTRVAELEAVSRSRDTARKHYEDLRKHRLNLFMAGFSAITLRLKEMYQMITLGGDAELELENTLDPFLDGIRFTVRPPKKSWKQISNLSGGEKTLASLALIFALHYYKPTPLYVMDEIDAALDFKNVSIVANYIKDRTKDAQFIIISLRNNMFELADRLVGIYKTKDVTKSITINPKAIAAKIEGKKEALETEA